MNAIDDMIFGLKLSFVLMPLNFAFFTFFFGFYFSPLLWLIASMLSITTIMLIAYKAL